MTSEQIEQINAFFKKRPYCDSKVLNIDCLFCGDEVYLDYLDYDDYGNASVVRIKFLQCYRVEYIHCEEFDKRICVKDMVSAQKPYFLQDISITKLEQSNNLWQAEIDCSMLTLKIRFKELEITDL